MGRAEDNIRRTRNRGNATATRPSGGGKTKARERVTQMMKTHITRPASGIRHLTDKEGVKRALESVVETLTAGCSRGDISRGINGHRFPKDR